MPAPRSYDFIGFDDEIPGVLALIAAAREYRRRTGTLPRSLLVSKSSTNTNLRGTTQTSMGGHLARRGRLAYLDRVPLDVQKAAGILGTFKDTPALYAELWQRVGVRQISLNPDRASLELDAMRKQAGIDLLDGVEIAAVEKDNQGRITTIKTNRGEIYEGKFFIDSSINAELAQKAGVRKLKGFETFGLPDSELAVTNVFETEGLSVDRLRAVELAYIKRFTNPNDTEAQQWFRNVSGNDKGIAEMLRRNLNKPMDKGVDYLDIYSSALSIAYHAFRGKRYDIAASGAILDKANIAILDERRNILSWNALLFFVTADQAELLAQRNSLPEARMLEEIQKITQFFKSIGASNVVPAPKLYIRHAGNITDVVEPLTGARMLAGGVPNSQALGTFSYYFDSRGSIRSLPQKAAEKGFGDFTVTSLKPVFNIGIRHALSRTVPNLAVVSPASGFEGIASTAGRIVQFNAGVGQGVGIACAIALLNNKKLADMTNAEVRSVLVATNTLPPIYGKSVDPAIVARLQAFEQNLGGIA
jgi:hypothetical protein